MFYLCHLVCRLSLHWPSDWLGRLTLTIYFVSKGFRYKDQIEDFIVVV